MNALGLALVMFLLIVAGYAARKLKVVDAHFGASLASFIFNIVFPALIIRSMNIPFNVDDLRNGAVLMLICSAVMLAMYLVANATNAATGKSGARTDGMARILRFAMMFPNYTFMAYPVIQALYGTTGLFYVTMYTMPMRIVFYTIGPLIMAGRAKRAIPAPGAEPLADGVASATATAPATQAAPAPGKKADAGGLAALLNPAVLSIPIGLLLYLFSVQLPEPLGKSLDYLASVATPMGMVVSGIALADSSLSNLFSEARVFLLSVLRLLVAPALVFGALSALALVPGLAVDPLVLKVAVVFSAMPAASSTTIFALRFRTDPERAAQTVFVTTVLSILTVPLVAALLG
jgi:malate permease and related proteins